MIDFMVIGLPRSGTAWLANWFTTDRTLCWHEALMRHSLDELDSMPHVGYFGVSETTLCLYDPERVNRHKAKKLIVHRPIDDVNASLELLGLPPMDETFAERLDRIEGTHIHFDNLFNAGAFRAAHESLVPIAFDAARYSFLRDMNIQNQTAIAECQGAFNG